MSEDTPTYHCIDGADAQLAMVKTFVDVQQAQMNITLGADRTLCPNCVFYANLVAAMSGLWTLAGRHDPERFFQMVMDCLGSVSGTVVEQIASDDNEVDDTTQTVH